MKTLKKQYWIVCLFLLAVCFLGFMEMPKVLAESNVAYSQTAAIEINRSYQNVNRINKSHNCMRPKSAMNQNVCTKFEY